MKEKIKNIFKIIIPTKLRYLIFSLRQISNNQNIPREIANIKKDLLFFKILHHFKNNKTEEYQNEINYLDKIGTLNIFPYNRIDKKINNIMAGFDKKNKMPFVTHKDKKLYFPKHYSVEQAKNEYLNLIVNENILEEKFWEKTPHQYTTELFSVKNDDIVLDIGASEGLFLLNVIDKIKKGFIFEPDKIWLKALKVTFEPFKEKIIIINKFASNKNSTNELTIDYCLKNEHGNVFVKIDVEGSENMVLNGAKSILERKNDIRVVCCTYHKHGDANLFEKFFKNLNYYTEFSDGYMIFFYDNAIKPPYFRKGLIRAKNININ